MSGLDLLPVLKTSHSLLWGFRFYQPRKVENREGYPHRILEGFAYVSSGILKVYVVSFNQINQYYHCPSSLEHNFSMNIGSGIRGGCWYVLQCN